MDWASASPGKAVIATTIEVGQSDQKQIRSCVSLPVSETHPFLRTLEIPPIFRTHGTMAYCERPYSKIGREQSRGEQAPRRLAAVRRLFASCMTRSPPSQTLFDFARRSAI
jgi:hypothetical protein